MKSNPIKKDSVTLPNIIHISWHDAGRYFGCYGVDTVSTPNIDRLAAGGTLFENAFACAAMCSPSRGACMTGRYPQTNGLLHLCHGNFGYRYHEGEKHLSQLLKEKGYHTALHGFEHEVNPGSIREELPYFDEYHNVDPAPPVYPIPPCDVVAEGAVDFLERQAKSEGPFYLQLGFFEVHRPYNFGGCEPDESLGITIPPYIEDNAKARADQAELQGAIRKADNAVGRVLDALDRLDIAENTLVIFMPDHGLPIPRAKATLYDPGIEIALVMRCPALGLPVGKRESSLVGNVDLVPTIFDLLECKSEVEFDGKSFAHALRSETEQNQRQAIFAMHHEGDVRAVRTDRFKWIRNFSKLNEVLPPVDIGGGAWFTLGAKGSVGLAAVELYDLENDPLETCNLADDPEFADVRKRLDAQLYRWMMEVKDPVLQGAITTPRHQEHLRQLALQYQGTLPAG